MDTNYIEAVYDEYRAKEVSGLPDTIEPFFQSLEKMSEVTFILNNDQVAFITKNIKRVDPGSFIIEGEITRNKEKGNTSNICMYLYTANGFEVEVYTNSSHAILRKLAKIEEEQNDHKAWMAQKGLRP